MDKKQLALALHRTFGDFTVHESCIDEFTKLIAKTGLERKFLSLLSTRMLQVKKFGETVHMKSNEFEKLKAHGLYSMHLKVKKNNLRILYGYSISGEAFLLAFFEQEGKRTSEYERYLEPARKRLDEINLELSQQ